jgi:hypothetical protein
VAQVRGVVTEVQATETSVNVLLSSGSVTGTVNCSLAGSETGAELSPGGRISTKGRCAGFLMDVSVLYAVRVE